MDSKGTSPENFIENSYVLETLHEYSSVAPRVFLGIPLSGFISENKDMRAV